MPWQPVGLDYLGVVWAQPWPSWVTDCGSNLLLGEVRRTSSSPRQHWQVEGRAEFILKQLRLASGFEYALVERELLVGEA